MIRIAGGTPAARRLAMLAAVLVLAACGGSRGNPPPAVDVTGCWGGAAARTITASGVAKVSVASAWMTLDQRGAAVTGSYVTDEGTARTSGTLSGVVSGRTMRATITQGDGCTGTLIVTATLDPDSQLRFDYQGSSSCSEQSGNGVLARL